MKSKIWIDIDEQNYPAIRVKYQKSDDVRDKLIDNFFKKATSLHISYKNGIYEGDDECVEFEAVLTPVIYTEVVNTDVDMVIMQKIDYNLNIKQAKSDGFNECMEWLRKDENKTKMNY